MAIVLLIPDKPNVKNLITERGQPSPFENYTYSKTFEANTSFILFFLLFNVLSRKACHWLLWFLAGLCLFSSVSISVRHSLIKGLSLDTYWRAKILFGTFLYKQLSIPDLHLRILHKIIKQIPSYCFCSTLIIKKKLAIKPMHYSVMVWEHTLIAFPCSLDIDPVIDG